MSDPRCERPLSGAASGDLPDSPLLPDPHVGRSPARKTEGSARAWALDNKRAPRKFLRLAEITAIFRISFPKPTLRADAAQDRACMVEPAKSRLEPACGRSQAGPSRPRLRRRPSAGQSLPFPRCPSPALRFGADRSDVAERLPIARGTGRAIFRIGLPTGRQAMKVRPGTR